MDSNSIHSVDQNSLVVRLGTVSFFKHMSVSALKDIVFSGQVQAYPADSTLFREGGEAAGLFVLLRGQINLCKVGLQGIEYIVHIVKPVTMLNEITVIDMQPNPVTAVAIDESITWHISPDNYHRIARTYTEVNLGLMHILAERNRILLAQYEDLMSRPVLARTAKLLYTFSNCGRQPINRYEHPNYQIAAMATTVPEAISRSIKILKENGVIECTRSQIMVLSVDALTHYALIEPSFLYYGSGG